MEWSGPGGGGRRRAEADPEPVEGVHQADRIGEIGKFRVGEFGSGRIIGGIGYAGLENAGDGFRPGEGCAFAGGEDVAGIVPDGDEHKLLHRQAGLQQVAGMHVDAEGAAIDQRHPQIGKIDQVFRQAALRERGVYGAEGLVAFRRGLGVVDAIRHDPVLLL